MAATCDCLRQSGRACAHDVASLNQPLPRHVLSGSLRYDRFAPLAPGGKAEVLRCRDTILGREVAYKVLHHHLLGDHAEEQMLVREARLMARLTHPAIPQVHDLGRDCHGRPYFTQSLVSGVDLHHVLERARRGELEARAIYSIERLVRLLMEAAAALDYAHQAGIVHGDVKPGNLLAPPAESVRIVDWGLARMIELDDEHPVAKEACRQGSPLYISPERATGPCGSDPRSDVYSLGAVLYECLTLEPLVAGSTVAEVLKNVVNAEPIPPRRRAPYRGITSGLEEVCLRALAKSPEDRFSTAGEFAAALGDCHLEMLVSFERDADSMPPQREASFSHAEGIRLAKREADWWALADTGRLDGSVGRKASD